MNLLVKLGVLFSLDTLVNYFNLVEVYAIHTSLVSFPGEGLNEQGRERQHTAFSGGCTGTLPCDVNS